MTIPSWLDRTWTYVVWTAAIFLAPIWIALWYERHPLLGLSQAILIIVPLGRECLMELRRQ